MKISTRLISIFSYDASRTESEEPTAAGSGRWLDRWIDGAGVWVFFVAALAVRLHWNLVVHPGGDYIYSDMRGYMDRADGIFGDPFGVREYDGFYPYGTHVLLYGIMAVFGRGNDVAISATYAVLGAATVAYGTALARLVSRTRWVPLAVGAALVGYYPLISLGGYFLSEVPFSLCLTAASVYLLRLVRDGRQRDAWAMGVFVTLGFTLRPQIVLSCIGVGLMWLVFRRRMTKVRLLHWGVALFPLVLVMAFSSWRLHHHTGRFGLIAENSTFNQVFGRCHVKKITALPDLPTRRRTSFGPPPMIQLFNRAERAPGEWPQLDPAMALEFEYRGYIGDEDSHRRTIDECVARTGWKKQAEYALVHELMLWRYNVMWPDSGKAAWQGLAHAWGLFVANAFAVPALLAMVSVFMPGRFLGLGLVSTHLWALTLLAALYWGDVRFRAPYDPVIILMALEAYAVALSVAWAVGKRLLRRVRSRRRTSPSRQRDER